MKKKISTVHIGTINEIKNCSIVIKNNSSFSDVFKSNKKLRKKSTLTRNIVIMFLINVDFFRSKIFNRYGGEFQLYRTLNKVFE